MFARCPNCQKIHVLSPDELRLRLGEFHCTRCATEFDPLTYLTEPDEIETGNLAGDPPAKAVVELRKSGKVKKAKSDADPFQPLPPAASKLAKYIWWGLGCLAALILLVVQLIYFEGYAVTQKPDLRVWAEKICDAVDCQLPAYQNVDEFEVLHRSLAQSSEGYYVFNLVFSNQASFHQPYPKINLTLLDFDGRPFAYRQLQPSDYLPGLGADALIEVDAVTQIKLEIDEPRDGVGGFDFNFVF